VPKIGHSGKPIFPECCTRGRNELREESLSRVSQNPWNSGKGGTRGKMASLSATLGEEGHSQKKICIWRQHWTEPFAKTIEKSLLRVPCSSTRGRWPLPRVPCAGTRGRSLFPESLFLALGEGSLPECHAEALGEIFLFF
jgi:hypothetical protein